jgi:thiamine-monophosphate kinase
VTAPEHPQGSAEDRLIARYFAPLARHPGALALSDDAAAFTPPPGHDLIVTKDAVVAGVHFFASDPADAVARKALRVNLSDLAAKGAQPAGFLLALGLPEVDPDWLAGFARGLGEDAETYRCPLLGGDTVRTTGPLFVSITAFGTVPHGAMVRRKGARPGDLVMVTGTIGDAALGLRLRQDKLAGLGLAEHARAHLAGRYLLPEPRNALADALRQFATAAMDLSDGLTGDLAKLCRVSDVSAEVDIPRVPLSAAAKAAVGADEGLLPTILAGGDDYELLFALPPERLAEMQRLAGAAGVAITPIGRFIAGGPPPLFRDSTGRPLDLARAGFSHF